MQYFKALPRIYYTDKNGRTITYKNLLTRVNIIPSVLNNPMAYYQYDIQEGDTPEIIAYKYYNDIYRYWIVMFSNQLLDPQWDWPMSQSVFNNYLAKKYNFNTTATVHHYEKVLTQTNSETLLPESQTIEISFDESQISIEELLLIFFHTHDPTTLNRQGNDVGSQYRSVIFYANQAQKEAAERVMQKLKIEHVFDSPIVTELSPLTVVYPAEEYHQNYYNQNSYQPYCSVVIAPKLSKLEKAFSDKTAQ